MTLVRRAKSYTEAELDGTQRRFSLVVAVFGASCNLLCLILTLYQDDSFSWQDIRHPRDFVGLFF
jgi:hypothetical protein